MAITATVKAAAGSPTDVPTMECGWMELCLQFTSGSKLFQKASANRDLQLGESQQHQWRKKCRGKGSSWWGFLLVRASLHRLPGVTPAMACSLLSLFSGTSVQGHQGWVCNNQLASCLRSEIPVLITATVKRAIAHYEFVRWHCHGCFLPLQDQVSAVQVTSSSTWSMALEPAPISPIQYIKVLELSFEEQHRAVRQEIQDLKKKKVNLLSVIQCAGLRVWPTFLTCSQCSQQSSCCCAGRVTAGASRYWVGEE